MLTYPVKTSSASSETATLRWNKNGTNSVAGNHLKMGSFHQPSISPSNDQQASPDPPVGCTRLAVLVLGTFIAPVVAGFALDIAFVTGGAVLFGVFDLPRGADPSVAILFVLALITLLLAGILFVLSVKR
jgi:hypothetical protein